MTSIELEIHPIQTDILRVLLFTPKARFSELNTTDLPTDHFNFHLKRLIEIGVIEKIETGYQLTIIGKEFANRFDTDKKQIEKQAKIGVLICGMKKENSVIKYLTQKRLKQPYFGFSGFITGKVKWGETVYEAAHREFQEETGLSATFTLAGIKHKMDYEKSSRLLEDKYFFVFRGENPRGKLIENFEGGQNAWLSEKQINQTPNLFGDVDKTLALLKNKQLTFLENKYTVEKY